MSNEPYEVVDDGMIRVCAWCYPGEKIFDLFPDLRGKVKISHGMCQSHLTHFKEVILRQRDHDPAETFMPNGKSKPVNPNP
jgi:hypothetical protein